MKTIILTFVICFCIYPQQKIITVQDKLVYLITKYEQECYADSSVIYYNTYCDLECWSVLCIKDSLDYLGQPCTEHWVHRVPNWEGFIEFIKKEK